jgi:hypothetical protein
MHGTFEESSHSSGVRRLFIMHYRVVNLALLNLENVDGCEIEWILSCHVAVAVYTLSRLQRCGFSPGFNRGLFITLFGCSLCIIKLRQSTDSPGRKS